MLIEGFLKDTRAIVPLPNPAYNASARPEAAAPPAADPLEGWKARGCEATVKNGIVTLTGTGSTPFLGFAAGKIGGPTVVSLRVRSTAGGAGKVEWLPTPQDTDKAKSVLFNLKASEEWQELTVTLPAEGTLGILRLYLPAQKEPLLLDWIEVKPAQGKSQRWSFDK